MTDNTENMTAAEMLRKARTTGRRKRELQTIAKQLCIREEFLAALESGEYDKIPELVYILGFARNYAVELELDPKIIVAKIKAEMNIPADEDVVLEKPSKTALPDQKKTVAEAAGKARAFLGKNWKWISAIAASAIVIVLAVCGISTLAKQGGDRGETHQETVLALPKFNMPIKEEFGVENRAAASVILQATQESWVKIEDAQGETMFSRVLVPGDVYYVPNGNVKGTFGNAGGLDVWVSGQQAPKLGPNHTRKAGIIMTAEALTSVSN